MCPAPKQRAVARAAQVPRDEALLATRPSWKMRKISVSVIDSVCGCCRGAAVKRGAYAARALPPLAGLDSTGRYTPSANSLHTLD